jgi:hypothetical protein
MRPDDGVMGRDFEFSLAFLKKLSSWKILKCVPFNGRVCCRSRRDAWKPVLDEPNRARKVGEQPSYEHFATRQHRFEAVEGVQQ